MTDEIPTEMPYTFEEVCACKDFTQQEIVRDWDNLVKFDALTNPRKFCGSRIIYKYQLRNMLNCRRGTKNYKTLEEWFATPELANELWRQTVKRNSQDKVPYPRKTDVYECHRLNNGAIVSFKPSTAKYVYKLFNAKNILDPTAGWGGRMLAAMSLGIDYTGYDTNTNMMEAYNGMMRFRSPFPTPEITMNWSSCLEGDFKESKYDLVLTSPPYANMELYEEMTPWKDDDDFYKTFMLPLMAKLFAETNCPICINISPKMYKALTETYGHQACDQQIDLRQQLGKVFGTKSQDYIYVWNR